MRARTVTVLLAVCAAVGLLLAPTGAAAAEPGALRLTEAAGSGFPEKTFRLDLGRDVALTPDRVTVVENGAPVEGLRLDLPGSRGGPTVGVVLLIDTSDSMEGAPIEGAMDAARTFVERLPEGVLVSAVLFDRKPRTVLEFTDDRSEMKAALAGTPDLAFGTRIYDAVNVAQLLLVEAGVGVGSIVLLSDGADVGSVIAPEEALARVRDAKARVFSVGLRSGQFNPSTLRALAAASGGTYAEASNASDLGRVYTEIGDMISGEYLLRYDSAAGPAQDVYVTVRVAGFPGTSTARYVTPGAPAASVAGPSAWDRFIQSPFTAILVGLIVVALVGYGTYLLARRRDRSLERRMASFVTLSPLEQSEVRKLTVKRSLAEQEAIHEQSFSFRELRWYARLRSSVDVGRIPLSARSIVLWTVAACLGVALLAVLAFGTGWAALLGIVPPFVAWALVNRRVRSVRGAFADQLPETLDVVSSALRAGHSLSSALSVAVEGSTEPLRSELGRAIADEKLGVPLDDALHLVSRRMADRDLMQVALVARLQREAGTNAAEVLDQVATNIRHQMELRRLVRSLTAQGRMSRWIVSLLPFVLFGAMFVLNRDYLSPLWETPGGIAAMIGGCLMILAGSWVIKKIVEFEV